MTDTPDHPCTCSALGLGAPHSRPHEPRCKWRPLAPAVETIAATAERMQQEQEKGEPATLARESCFLCGATDTQLEASGHGAHLTCADLAGCNARSGRGRQERATHDLDSCHNCDSMAATKRSNGRTPGRGGRVMKPWHDTPTHNCGDGKQGPIAPAFDHPSQGNPRELRCCACGARWVSSNDRYVAHAWWSAGAYEGKEVKGKSDGE